MHRPSQIIVVLRNNADANGKHDGIADQLAIETLGKLGMPMKRINTDAKAGSRLYLSSGSKMMERLAAP